VVQTNCASVDPDRIVQDVEITRRIMTAACGARTDAGTGIVEQDLALRAETPLVLTNRPPVRPEREVETLREMAAAGRAYTLARKTVVEQGVALTAETPLRLSSAW